MIIGLHRPIIVAVMSCQVNNDNLVEPVDIDNELIGLQQRLVTIGRQSRILRLTDDLSDCSAARAPYDKWQDIHRRSRRDLDPKETLLASTSNLANVICDVRERCGVEIDDLLG